MILDDGHGTRFSLRVLGYQFPHLRDHDYDSNWLTIEVRLDTPDGSWVGSDSCVMTDELGWLALWLRKLAGGARQPDEVCFMEPYIGFQRESVLGSRDVVIVRLAQHFRPNPPDGDDPAYFEPLRIRFTPSADELLAAADSLDAAVQRFPPRAGWERRPPFVPRQFLPSFVIEWLFLPPSRSARRAVQLVERLMEEYGHPVEVRGCEPAPQPAGRWQVRAVTRIPVAVDNYGDALYRFLLRLPRRYGRPLVHLPILHPDGAFHIDVELLPRRDPDDRGPFTRVRWWGMLMNFEDERRVRWLQDMAFGTQIPPQVD